MSQAGIINVIENNPTIPIYFEADTGFAVALFNVIRVVGAGGIVTSATGNTITIDGSGIQPNLTLTGDTGGPLSPTADNWNIVGGSVAAATTPVQVNGAVSTLTVNVQRTQAVGSSAANRAGIGSFNSAQFSVDSNGYVSLLGGAAVTSFNVDASTAPGTDPVVPDGSGIVTVTGGQVAAGTTANVIQTNSLAANTYTIQIQRASAQAVATVGANGVAHFDSTKFTVDANGFVSVSGTGLAQTITGDSGGALSPTGGNWNILGASTAAGSTPVSTSGAASTLTVNVQKAQAIAASNAANVGLAAFDNTKFTVDANGFVSISGTAIGQTITGNTGGALSPVAGNWNIVGTGSTTAAGSGNTLTIQLTGLTNHAVLVGAGTATITKVGPTATAGQVLQSAGSSADPAFSTATYPSTTTINQILYSSAANTVTGLATVNSAVLTTTNAGVPQMTALATNGQLIIGSTAGAPAAATLTQGTGIIITNGSNSITIGVSGAVGQTITGNTGGALSPSSGNWNIVTANSIPSFAGSGSTLTLDFSQTNLSLGSALPSLAGGIFNAIYGGNSTGAATTSGSANTIIGSGTATSLNSGSNNVIIGQGAGTAITSSTANVAIGVGCLAGATTGANARNTAIGYTALNGITTGAANIAIGYAAGTSLATSDSSNVCIMHAGVAGDSNTMRLGTTGSANGNVNRTFIAAVRSVSALTNSAPVGVDSSGQFCSLGFGTSGQVFTSNGASTTPTWQNPITATTQNSAVASGSAVSLTTATNANVTNISLAAGTWVVTGIIQFGGSPTVSGAQRGSISTTSATHGNLGDNSVQSGWLTGSFTNGNVPIEIPSYILTVGSTTTVYLVASGVFSAGTMNAYGRISAVRIA